MADNAKDQKITATLEENYLPYAMSVIISRALPEIDGLKPSHRKLLYTMYKMGLLTGTRTKSANVVGQTMHLNPHGDLAIYDTLVRLSRGNQTLLHSLVDSKGNFGKVYSRDMSCAAARYTEVKLDSICAEFFASIDEDSVDFVDNYDNTMKEPTLLPVRFPHILVNPNLGIAVGMGSNFCSFNLGEVCDTTIAYIKNPKHDIASTLKAPDFSTGGELIYDRDAMEEIYRTGRGSFKVRARWRFAKKDSCIEVYEIPYTTTVEAILDKIVDLVKNGRIKEITNVRDESDLSGLKLTIDIKKGTDPDKLMQKLFRFTTLTDSFGCNFNLLISGRPFVLGIAGILDEWTAWRTECIRRCLYFRLSRMKERLHLLTGLKKILLDIDKAIAIIRNTEEDAEVIPNLMIGFGIDEAQAEFIVEIKLRNINKEYILKRINETSELEKNIADTEDTINSKAKIKAIIISELEAVKKKYAVERRTGIIYEQEIEEYSEEDDIENYAVHYFVTEGGYFKKITPLSLRMGGTQKLKEGDRISDQLTGTNRDELLVFTTLQRAYKIRGAEFEDTKASSLGDYLPSKLSMDEGETAVCVIPAGDYSGHLLFVYANGKAAKIELKSYDTVSNRRRLTGAFSAKAPLVSVLRFETEGEAVLYSSAGRALIFSTALLTSKSSRDSQGVQVMTLKSKHTVVKAILPDQAPFTSPSRYRVRTLPAAGALLKAEDTGEVQLTLDLM